MSNLRSTAFSSSKFPEAACRVHTWEACVKNRARATVVSSRATTSRRSKRILQQDTGRILAKTMPTSPSLLVKGLLRRRLVFCNSLSSS